jgi:hypothetical protein
MVILFERQPCSVVKFLQGSNANNVVAMIQQGAMVLEAPESAAIAGN